MSEKRKFTAQEAREKFMNRKKRMMKLDASLPDLEDLDGQLGMLELTAKEIEKAQEKNTDNNGILHAMDMTALMITKSLVMIDTREKVFSEDDSGYIVENFGLSVIQPLGMKIQEVNNISTDALEIAKKNLSIVQGSASATSSEKNSVGPEHATT